MSIKYEQLAELTELINDRIAEWELPPDVSIGNRLSCGLVRLVRGVIWEWEGDQSMPELERIEPLEEYTQDRLSYGYSLGFEAGRESMRRELQGDKADEGRLVTNSAPEPEVTDVVGPTGATLAETGLVRLGGDGYGKFDRDGQEIAFRITMSDDEANADRYYRGFNDGVEFAKGGEQDDPDDAPYDPDPDGRQALAAYHEAVEALVGKEAIEAIRSAPQGAGTGENGTDPEPTPQPDTVFAPAGADLSDQTPPAPEFDYTPRPLSRIDLSRRVPKPQLPDPDEARANVATMLASSPQDIVGVVNGKSDSRKEQSDLAKARNVSYEQVIAELKRMAMGTRDMPTMAQWNESKPTHYPLANSICYKHNCGWPDLAKDAGLKMKARGQR